MGDIARLEFDVASALSLGARPRQEDAVAIAFPDGAAGGFAVLSDGIGGHASGDMASRTIVAEMFAELTLGRPPAAADAPAVLQGALARANDGLRACVEARPDHRGMGGTVVATLVAEGRLHWISVGDSVLYLFRDEKLSRLNDDHSMAPQLDLMVAKGLLTEAEARDHPQRNALTSALMGEDIAETDCPSDPLALRPGDVFVLASDGLQFLPDPIIEALLLRARRDNSRDIARDLVDAIHTLNDPEQDNMSVIVVRVERARARARPGGFRATSTAFLKSVRRALAPSVQMRGRG